VMILVDGLIIDRVAVSVAVSSSIMQTRARAAGTRNSGAAQQHREFDRRLGGVARRSSGLRPHLHVPRTRKRANRYAASSKGVPTYETVTLYKPHATRITAARERGGWASSVEG
jgi:hypothetical protein